MHMAGTAGHFATTFTDDAVYSCVERQVHEVTAGVTVDHDLSIVYRESNLGHA